MRVRPNSLILCLSLAFLLLPAALPAGETCRGLTATIVGTERNDVLRGTPGNDVTVGLGGNDTIFGEGGNDTICGGDGNDARFGGSGDDFLDGGAGNNTLHGDDGIDGCTNGKEHRCENAGDRAGSSGWPARFPPPCC